MRQLLLSLELRSLRLLCLTFDVTSTSARALTPDFDYLSGFASVSPLTSGPGFTGIHVLSYHLAPKLAARSANPQHSYGP